MNPTFRSFPSRCAGALACGVFLGLLPVSQSVHATPPPFAIQGPGVNAADFRITVFASGISFPLGMVKLSDGSILVAISDGTSFWSGSVGRLLRLVDADGNGVADGAGTVLYTGLTGGQTSLRHYGNLFFVTGQGVGRPITILRAGATPASALTLVGKISINYPSGSWMHPHSALNLRPTPGHPESCDLFFQLGSDQNFAKTTRTATLSSSTITGATGTLQGESIYKLTITDNGTSVVASALTRVAKGLRNAAGFAFHPVTGDLYLEDNGIDGLVNVNEPLSADELNVVPAAQIDDGTVPDFGFPTNYTAYDTGVLVGGGGVQPLVAFQPVPDGLLDSESEGPNDIAFAPPGFPPGLDNGIFVGFHGKWALGGLLNEENPLVFADLRSNTYFQFIGNKEPGIGHLDGLMSTDDSLFLADLTATGSTENSNKAGMIYQIKSLVSRLAYRTSHGVPELTWPAGVLQQADDLSGQWGDVQGATSPYPVGVDPARVTRFYRTRN